MGGDSALFHPLPVIPHKAQMPLPPIQPTLLYYAVANTLPPPMQPLCGMGALIPMPPTRLMPPASTNCAVCHFRGMCLAYPAYPISNPPTATCSGWLWLRSWCHFNIACQSTASPQYAFSQGSSLAVLFPTVNMSIRSENLHLLQTAVLYLDISQILICANVCNLQATTRRLN